MEKRRKVVKSIVGIFAWSLAYGALIYLNFYKSLTPCEEITPRLFSIILGVWFLVAVLIAVLVFLNE